MQKAKLALVEKVELVKLGKLSPEKLLRDIRGII